MSDAEAAAAAPPKSKKMLIIIVVVVLALVGAGAAFFLKKKNVDEDGEEVEEAPAAHAAAPAGTPPAYLPLDNMVVNLADPGGERVAQVGVTLELGSEHDVEAVKAYMPAIRSDILLLLSQRTADELLSREGKDKLSEDILESASSHFEPPEQPTKGKKKKAKVAHVSPVQRVLFSSFIVQ